MVSIRQKTYPDLLPDFRNVGVIARILIAVNAAVLAGALFAAPDLTQALQRFVQAAALAEPLLLLMITVLFAVSGLLARLPYWGGFAAVVGLIVAIAAGYLSTVATFLEQPIPGLLNTLALCALLAVALLIYLRLLTKAHSPALAEARLQALQARIRPHFLFNSMNTIASLTRSDPRLAEQAIGDLSDLFRASLREHRERIPLGHEIEIARAYERVERLRLGARLAVDWQVDGLPMDAPVPALILQPLLENAVYHGIEPLEKGGTIRVAGRLDGRIVTLTIDNPVAARVIARRTGHRIGLENVRQRLELMFHGEAGVEVIEAPERFVVTLRFPAVESPA